MVSLPLQDINLHLLVPARAKVPPGTPWLSEVCFHTDVNFKILHNWKEGRTLLNSGLHAFGPHMTVTSFKNRG